MAETTRLGLRPGLYELAGEFCVGQMAETTRLGLEPDETSLREVNGYG